MHVEDPNTPETSATDDALAAMDAGLTAAAESEPAPEPVADPGIEPTAEPDGDGEPAADPQPEPVADAAPEPRADEPTTIDAEVTSLGLKEKAAERFRELSADREAMAPVRAAMKDLGLEDPAKVAQALSRVRDADYVMNRVVETQASVDQFDKSLEYLSLVNRGAQGDMQALEQAWALIEPELQVIAKALGKEVPGIVDPLADHDDLREDVEAGDLPRARALEIARQRQRDALIENQRNAQRATQEQTQAQQQAVDTGRQGLNELGAELQAADPARYAALGPALVAKVKEITASHPPSEWVARAARAYATLPLPAAAPAPRAPVRHVPMRPTGGRPDLAPTTFDDPMAALDFGIAQAGR